MNRKLIRALLWIFAAQVAGWIVGQIIAKKMTKGDETSDEFQVATIMGGKKFESHAKDLKSGVVITSMGGIDLVMDPNDPQTLFAAMYQRQRKAWGFNGGGPGSGIYRTTDGGASWVELTVGLPSGDKGRIGLDVYRRDGNLVCALVEADVRAPGQGRGGGGEGDAQNGVYCSTDRGQSWERRSTTNNRPMYYSQIRIDPNDPERMYLGGSDLFRSSDGGRTFTNDAADGVHLDHHALWIDPNDSEHLILGSDGGVSISWDRSDHWFQFRNLPIAQLYEVDVDARDPYHVCGGLQDNGSWCAPSDTWSNQGIRTRDWYNVGSGDGFSTVMHPTDPNVMFAESQGGNITRVNLTTGERARLRPIGRPDPDGELPELRWNWNAPVLLSAHDDNTVYVGANVLFRSNDQGQSWEPISPEQTQEIDRETLKIMGVSGAEAQISLNDGQSSFGNLTALAESPIDANVLYTGSDDGRVRVTRDGGASWTDLAGAIQGLPEHTYVTRLVASHGAAGTVFAAFDAHRSDDFAPYVYRSDDFGENWRQITSGLPHISVNALAQHPRNADLLFLGNEVGVYASIDGGQQWVEIGNGLPTVPVDDIIVHTRENDLVIGTHGRGIWILDDITPLERLDSDVIESDAFVFAARRTTSYNAYTPQGWTPGVYAAPNPPAGARIRYYLSTETDDVGLRITTATGVEIRELEASGDEGLNEVIWDLRLVEDDADGEPMDPGPRVMPGTYLIELTTGANLIQSEVTVRLDPRVSMSRREIMARHQAMMDAYRLSGPVSSAEDALADTSERLDEVEALLEGADDPSVAISEEVGAIRSLVAELEDELDDAAGGARVMGRIQGFSGPPTADDLWQVDRSWRDVPDVIERVNEVVSQRLPALLGRVYADAVRPEMADPVPMPKRGR